MNIQDLTLAEAEKLAIGIEVVFRPENATLSIPDARKQIIDRIAEAQLAKALWGVVEWLFDQSEDKGLGIISQAACDGLARNLRADLAQAGISRPGGEG